MTRWDRPDADPLADIAVVLADIHAGIPRPGTANAARESAERSPAAAVTAVTARIDNALTGLCPCGADPRPGSPYCSADCEPTHIGVHTGYSGAHWRPDLLTPEDPFEYEPVRADTHYDGPFFARLLRPVDADGLHLRLDDGHRWVGLTIDRFGGEFTPEVVDQMRQAWVRLERQLTDRRYLAADPDDDEVAPPVRPRPGVADAARRWHAGQGTVTVALHNLPQRVPWRRRCRNCGSLEEPMHGQRVVNRDTEPAFTARSVYGMSFEVELCQACPTCMQPFPGPPLEPSIRHLADSIGGVVMRLTAIDGDDRRGYQQIVTRADLQRAPIPVAYIQQVWDRIEAKLLRTLGVPPARPRSAADPGRLSRPGYRDEWRPEAT